MVTRDCACLLVVFMVIMVISGYQWFSMVFYGYTSGFCGFHGYQWFSMATSGFLWLSWLSDGYTSVFMVFMVISGFLWLYTVKKNVLF